MQKRTFLSSHPSNPLEVPSSDPVNTLYRRSVEHMKDLHSQGMSSEDPICGYRVDEQVEIYQQHINTVRPGILDGAKGHSLSVLKSRLANGKEDSMNKTYCDSDDDLEIVYDDEDQTAQFQLPVEGQDSEHKSFDSEDETMDSEFGSDEWVDEEEFSIITKDQEEQQDIIEEIKDLEDAVPELVDNYRLIDRLGTGTFSSVYKAIVCTPPLNPQDRKVYVAIKRIYVTSSPERIRNEISILQDCVGCRNVSQLITAFRNRDQVVAIMPYHRNDDFRDFFETLSLDGLKSYFRCLMRALRDIHARGIIHRDVKPANFLFNTKTNIGTLCDFGLACRVNLDSTHGYCLHTPASRKFLHGQRKANRITDIEKVKAAQRDARIKSGWLSEKVGYPDNDRRPQSKANRAGTRGFRAPEVLLKCSEQTGAIDIWSSGVILLSFLTKKFPIFRSNDDIEALMEIATIIGRRKIECAAALHNRTFASNVPTITKEGMTWREFVRRNNPTLFNSSFSPSTKSTSHHSSLNSTKSSSDPPLNSDSLVSTDLQLAFDFLDLLLAPESVNRITARDALYHPFLFEPGLEDDQFVPHPIGDGICGQYHFRDDVTDEHRVHLSPDSTEVCQVPLGQGIPIGFDPCPYHANLVQFRSSSSHSREESSLPVDGIS